MTTSEPQPEAIPQDPRIRPFSVSIPQDDLDDLQRRIRETRLPEKEPVDDASQGVQLAGHAGSSHEYWLDAHDWRESRPGSTPARSSSPRSTAWTSTSSTCGRARRTRCR